jgi:hypothetical protein
MRHNKKGVSVTVTLSPIFKSFPSDTSTGEETAVLLVVVDAGVPFESSLASSIL